ncbi:immunity 49 family protein [Fusobacterium animalis]|uniref:Imm49 family immunity protein n=1 Tax=Fusobacterium TaxID=848 RepID=UPI0030CEF242
MLISKKKFNEKLEHLIKRIDLYKDGENDYLKRIEEKNGDCQYCMRLLGRIYITVASKELVVDKDIESFRKNIYIYSKLNLMGTDTRAYLAWKKMNFFCILMSNNKEFMDFILRNFDIIGHEKEKYKKSEADFYLMRTILLTLKGDWEEVIKRADFYSANPSKETGFKYFPLEFGFLRALAEKNIEKMKENINAMLEPKVARQMMYDESIFFYLHVYVLLYLKIASYYGFDLEIESDIVPKELIDNTPAKEYPEPYEFMKKFDLKTITPEEWKAWIYEYYPKPEILKEFEEKGSFI